MQTPVLDIVEGLRQQLMAFPPLIDQLQRRDLNFLVNLEKWMRRVESFLEGKGLAECSRVAAYRSKILAPLFGEEKGKSLKKMQLAKAAELLFDLQETVSEVWKRYDIKATEARELLINLMTILKQSKAIQYTDQILFQEFVIQIWRLVSTHEQLKPSIIKVLSNISQIDAQRIIAEELVLEEWK